MINCDDCNCRVVEPPSPKPADVLHQKKRNAARFIEGQGADVLHLKFHYRPVRGHLPMIIFVHVGQRTKKIRTFSVPCRKCISVCL